MNYFRTQIVDDKEHRNLKMTWNIVIKINKLDVSDVEYCKLYGKTVKVKTVMTWKTEKLR